MIAKVSAVLFGAAIFVPLLTLGTARLAGIDLARHDVALKGMQSTEDKPAMTLRTLSSGEYEDYVGRQFGEELPFRGRVIASVNTVLYRFFHKSYMGEQPMIIGRNGMVFEKRYADAYCRRQHSDAELDAWAQRIRALQDKVTSQGRTFIYLITPSKAAYFPELLPVTYHCDPETAHLDYRHMVTALTANGVHFLDSSKLMSENKSRYNVEMFSQGGTHWNLLGAAIATNALADEIRKLGGPDYSSLQYSWTISHEPVGTDTDLFDLLNLGSTKPTYAVPKMDVRIARRLPSQDRPITFVGGSFVGQVIELLHGVALARDVDELYYFKVHRTVAKAGSPIAEYPVNIDDASTYKSIYTSPVLVFEENESLFASNHGKLLMEKMGITQ
ncbi:alginate O-acetyltransferase AlgX-related protein [Burkholderia multivorans]|uniref:alginate O-acetyltransferase AlgX-related protein n=1 Tax=Burkholderia multivorans TaxID=87883 RepID=UPI0021C23A3A|nr:hypothetical protein [Burkholderia multivorans]